MEQLIQRIAALESGASVSGSLGPNFRVIEMHIARAEEKLLRISRGASWAHYDSPGDA